MISFHITFAEGDLNAVYEGIVHSANALSLLVYRKVETPDDSPEIPTYILFYPAMGVFCTLVIKSGSLSFRLEHPSYLSCDQRVKQVFFKFAHLLREVISERVAARGGEVSGHRDETGSFVRLKPALPQKASGLRFGEGAVWDEWSLVVGGARLWEQWRQMIDPPGDARKKEGTGRAFLEIGFGSGDFLAAEARAHPNALFIGVESSIRSLQYAEKKIRDLRNVRLIHADAIPFLRDLCPPGMFDGIYLHFPYPWEKRRHRYRRLIRRDTLIHFERAIAWGGFLQVVTDSRDYAHAIFRILRQSPHWFEVELTASAPAGLRSRYLRKWLLEGRSIWTIRGHRRVENRSAEDTRLWKPTLIPLSGTLCEFAVCGDHLPEFGRFCTRVRRQVVRLNGVFRDQSEVSLYRIVHVGEDGKAHRVYLLLKRAHEGRFSVEIPPGARLLSPQPVDAEPEDTLMCPDWLNPVVRRVQEEALRANLPTVFSHLLTTHKPQGWWPYHREEHLRKGTDYRDEIAVGAILTQATTWRNVERALACLKDKGALSLEGIARLSGSALASCLQPTRFPEIKVRRLLAFVQAFQRDFSGSWDLLKSSTHLEERRRWLLSIHGIGEETADSILCYALGDPVFVVDAYTRRLYRRLGYTPIRWQDDIIRTLTEVTLGHSAKDLAEFHALIVRHAREVCKARVPLCSTCSLRSLCAYARSPRPISSRK